MVNGHLSLASNSLFPVTTCCLRILAGTDEIQDGAPRYLSSGARFGRDFIVFCSNMDDNIEAY